MMLRLLRGMLRQLGYDALVTAEDGVAALQLLQQWPIDLVITDVSMPRMNGLELLQAMRATTRLHDIPVLIIAAEADKERVVQAMQLGIHGISSSLSR
jgi:two-component system chemotaxis response regulator CheY